MADTTVTFLPQKRTVRVEAGTTVLDAARRAGVPVDAPCAGRGVCGGCGVRVVSGSLAEPDGTERQGLQRAPQGVRLACRARVSGPVTLRPVAFSGPTTRPSGATVGVSRSGPCVAAVDLGTSTVAATIIDAETRVELGRAVVANRQVAWGADVISRIAAARDGAALELRLAAEDSIRDALGGACSGTGECLSSIGRLVIAGNTAMSSLLIGADVASLGAHPFAPPYSAIAAMSADSGLVSYLARGARTVVLPPLGGFVGGDALAGLMAAGMDAPEARGLFIDLGTNAEVALVAGAERVVASAAAGPAFEAVGLTSGGPAATGAIDRVEIDGEGRLTADVIGGGAPLWLCGSGLVSVVAGLRGLGHIGGDGRILPEGPLRDRFEVLDGVDVFRVANAQAGEAGVGIVLSQNDVRALQLAKGAVRAAIETLFEGVSTKDRKKLAEVVVAGSFGSALRPNDLVSLGVIPTSLSEKVRVIGNAALTGAAMLAVDDALERELPGAAAAFRHVDLAGDPGFSARFLDALALEPYDIR